MFAIGGARGDLSTTFNSLPVDYEKAEVGAEEIHKLLIGLQALFLCV